VDQLVRGSGGIDIHFISGDPRTVAPAEDDEPHRRSAWPDYFLAVEFVVVGTAVAAIADQFLALPDIVMVYLVAIILAAVRVGRGPAVLAATLSVAAYDFFFVPPRFTFAVSDTRHILTFAMMFAVGILLSELTVRVRTQARESRHREAITAALYALAKDLGAAADATAVARSLAQRAADAFDGSVAVLLAGPDGGLNEVARSGEAVLDARDLSVVRWAHAHGRPAGLGSDTLPGARATCVPLKTDGRALGVMAYVPRVPGRAPEAEQRHLLDALARQGALAIERVSLAEDAETAELRARTESMRSSLLSAVSHDLRTPLAAITGAASALTGGAPGLDAERRDELAETICEESVRLEKLVGNLLDMTRLASGALDVKREWIPAEELVGGVLTRMEGALSGRDVKTSVDPGLPLLSVDPVLFEQVLVNLVDNAIKHTPPGTPIEIGAHEVGSGIAIEVADRGSGIPAGFEEVLFEKFQRGSDAGSQGSGLGLAICRGIVEAHRGTIRAARRAGGGAVFTVLLPRSDDTPDAVTGVEEVAE
jgi:two-component system sensor histidine kinase KdpD